MARPMELEDYRREGKEMCGIQIAFMCSVEVSNWWAGPWKKQRPQVMKIEPCAPDPQEQAENNSAD